MTQVELGYSDTNQYSDKDLKPKNGYKSGYERPRPIEEQVKRISEIFDNLNGADLSVAERPLPEGAEGYFAIPRWQTIDNDYVAAVNLVLERFKEVRDGKFFNYRGGRLTPDVMCQHPRTVEAFDKIAAEQKGNDILIVPAQFGLKYAGISMRKARASMEPTEFGMGAFHVGIMLMTHPERLAQYRDLWADCIGDEYNDVGHEEHYGRSTRFIFDGGQEEFGTNWTKYAEYSDGSVTGFLPKSA